MARAMTDKNDLQDYDDFAGEDSPLLLPYRGKTYEVRPLPAMTGLRVQRLISAAERAESGKENEAADAQLAADAEELDLYPDVLGDVYEELLEDGVSYIRLKLAATAAMLWTVYDEETALEYWAASGKAPEPANRQQRRAKTTRTGGASSTKRPASGTGTSTRPKKSGSAPKGKG